MKFYSSGFFASLSALFLCGLLVLLSACSLSSASPQGNANQGDGAHTTHQTASVTSQAATPTVAAPQTVTMPQTDTSCPASSTARAAVMRPLALGKDQNIVYSDSATFKRYNVQTKSTTTILSLPHGTVSNVAQISADGQWVLFLSSQTNDQTQLQLVRMDGQGLQTLYCFANGQSPQDLQSNMQWSVDERLIAFAVRNDKLNFSSSIVLLDMKTGSLKTLFQAENSDFYGRIAWLDNTHLYVDREVRSTASQGTLYLMNVATASANNPGFQSILTYTANVGYISYDSSYDATKFFFSYCQQAPYTPVVTTITVDPATGGAQQAVLREKACIPMVRAVAPTILLMLAEIDNSNGTIDNQIWVMRPDGSGQQVLATLSPTITTQGINYSLNTNSQFPWSNVSRDGGSYALEENNGGGSDQGVVSNNILIGSLSGGNPTVIDIPFPSSGNGIVGVVGWTTM